MALLLSTFIPLPLLPLRMISRSTLAAFPLLAIDESVVEAFALTINLEVTAF